MPDPNGDRLDRLEADLVKLKERHEALTQTVEIMIAENDRRFAQIADRFADTDRRMGQVMEGIARLLHIAEIHERRLDDLESR